MTLYSFDSVIFYSFNNKAVNICKDIVWEYVLASMLGKIREYSLKVSSFLVYQILKNLCGIDEIVLAKITCPISQGNIMVLPNLINNISVNKKEIVYLHYRLIATYSGEIDFATPLGLIISTSFDVILLKIECLKRYYNKEIKKYKATNLT